MISVGLIGLDGAGKTSVAGALVERLPFKTRTIYMGTNLESSSILLPTSRLLRFFRKRRMDRRLGAGQEGAERASRQLASNRFRRPQRGPIGAGLRLAQRLSESVYRSAYVLALTRLGTAVICDRHLYYENLSRKSPGNIENRDLADRILFWYVERVLPRPDLVILLDVPGEVAHQRKPELSIDEFEKRRGALKACADEDRRIATVDATEPLDVVVDKAARVILNNMAGGFSRRLQEE